MKCHTCKVDVDRTTGRCPKCGGGYDPEHVERQDFLEAILSRNMDWTQNVEGYSLACLDEAIDLVTRHGIKIYSILASVKRGRILTQVARQAGLMKETGPWGGNAKDYCYRDIEGAWLTLWDAISDFEVYVIGDTYPPTKESIAVWTIRRPLCKENPQ